MDQGVGHQLADDQGGVLHLVVAVTVTEPDGAVGHAVHPADGRVQHGGHRAGDVQAVGGADAVDRLRVG